MKEWHDAHIEIITSAASEHGGREREGVELMPGLRAWKEAIDVDVVCSCEEWRPPVGVIWRGAIHFTENKVCFFNLGGKHELLSQTNQWPRQHSHHRQGQ